VRSRDDGTRCGSINLVTQRGAIEEEKAVTITKPATNLLRRNYSDLAPAANSPGCFVIHGAAFKYYRLAGHSVAFARAHLQTPFNIPEEAQAALDGDPVMCEDDCVIPDRYCTLEFVRQAGVKGLGELFSREQLQERWQLSDAQYLGLLRDGLPTLRLSDGSVRHPEVAVDEWARQYFQPQEQLPLPPGDQAAAEDRLLQQAPREISTAEAAEILGVSKDTVLSLKDSGLLEYRNTAPPGSSRPIYAFSLRSVMELRTSYQRDEPAPTPRTEPQRRRVRGDKKYKHLNLED
jgi:hypothetical protein